MREQIARDLAASDISKSLDKAHRDVAFAEDTMRTMLDNMSDGAMLYEGDGRWVYQNRAMARLHDMPDELLKSLPTFKDIVRFRALRGDYGPVEALPGGLEGWIASRVARFNLPGQPAERRRTVTGRTVEVTYRPLPGGRVLTVHRDLTDIVEQESRITQAQSERERTRATMRSVLDNMGDGAALYAPDGGLLFHNAAFGRLLDLDAATIATTSISRTSCASSRARRFRPGGRHGGRSGAAHVVVVTAPTRRSSAPAATGSRSRSPRIGWPTAACS